MFHRDWYEETVNLLITLFAICASLWAYPALGQSELLVESASPTNQELLRRLETLEVELRFLRARENEQTEPFTNPDHNSVRQIGFDVCDCRLCVGGPPVCQGAGSLCKLCQDSLAWNKGPWKITPFGFLTGEAIGSTAGTVPRPFVLYLNSAIGTGFSEEQFTVHGQTSALGLTFSGPKVGSFQLGGMFLYNYLGSRPALNQSSPFFLRGYGELKSDNWRFTFGQNGDLFNPLDPVTVNFGGHKQAGNAGAFRGSLRAERFLRPSDRTIWTLQAAISQQVINDFTTDPFVIGTDNGWPNIESRIALGLGLEDGSGRPVEVGLSSVIGQTRSLGFVQVVSDTWGVSTDLKVSGKRFGFRGEFLVGDAIGTYNAGIGQSLNPDTLEAIRTYAGWGDVWFKATDCLTFHVGYGIDDPRNSDLGVRRVDPLDPTSTPIAGQRSLNSVGWANLIWDVSKYFDIAFEVSHRETHYIAPSFSNEATVYHFRSRIKF